MKPALPLSHLKEGHLYVLKREEVQVPSPVALHVLVPFKRKYIYTVWSLCDHLDLFQHTTFDLSGKI
jgi:hypothetical protein